MSKITKTFRVLPETEAELVKLHGNVSAGATEAADAYVAIRKYTLSELKGMFTRDELTGLVSSLNGSMFEPSYAANTRMFAIHCQDAELYEYSFSSNGADAKALLAKVNALTAAQCYFLQLEIRLFWDDEIGRAHV